MSDNRPPDSTAIALAEERANAAQRDITRVEKTLSDRIDDLGTAVTEGFNDIGQKLEKMMGEITALKVENAKRSGAERAFKWLLTFMVTLALGIAGIVYTGHGSHPPQH